MKLDTALLAETPEGIDLVLRTAGAPARVTAYALDWLVRALVFFATVFALQPVRGFGTGLGLLLYFGLEWLYPIVFELMPGAATPGKRVLGLHVTMDNGLPVTPAASVVRNLLRAADFLPFAFGAGLASMLLRRDFKRLGDIVAGTQVVHGHRVRLHGELPPAEPLAPRTPLVRRQQVAILHLAGRAARLTPERVDELAAIAATALPSEDSTPREAVPPPSSPGRRLLAVAQWLAGQR